MSTSVSICLNPECLKPENPDGTKFCLSCGTNLASQLRERYRVISLLGSGGFGRTFLAEDTGMPSARRCVIKQLKPIGNNSQIYQLVQERFQREAAVLEELGEESSSIPSLYDYFTNAGQFYLVQQWIDGETLTQKVKKQGNLSEADCWNILMNILEVLDYVHSKGIIHRDIKPDNIILCRKDSKPVLIDFGAVKETMGTMVTSQGVPTSSIVIGTPGYMASEQAVGKAVRSSDLYSLGLTVIYALTGKIPQELPLDDDTGDYIWHQYAQNVSSNLTAILDKAIQLYPRDRYSKAKDMLNELQSGKSTPPVNVPLKTSRGNYTQLRDLLAAKKWQEADRETAQVMLKVAGVESRGFLNRSDCENFPGDDLSIINQLWLEYSNGRFGLSVQKQIWIDKCGGKRDYETDCKLGDRVGWRSGGSWKSYNQLDFSLNAPPGHLPLAGFGVAGGLNGWFGVGSLLWRQELPKN